MCNIILRDEVFCKESIVFPESIEQWSGSSMMLLEAGVAQVENSLLQSCTAVAPAVTSVSQSQSCCDGGPPKI